MTAEQFMHFLNQEQRDPRLNEILYPYCDLSKAQALISQFEEPSSSFSSSSSEAASSKTGIQTTIIYFAVVRVLLLAL